MRQQTSKELLVGQARRLVKCSDLISRLTGEGYTFAEIDESWKQAFKLNVDYSAEFSAIYNAEKAEAREGSEG